MFAERQKEVIAEEKLKATLRSQYEISLRTLKKAKAELQEMTPEGQWQRLLKARERLHKSAAQLEANPYQGPEALKELQEQLTAQEFETWLRKLSYLRSAESEVVISVPSSFYRSQVESRYQRGLEQTLRDLSGQSIRVEFVVDEAAAAAIAEQEAATGNDKTSARRPDARPEPRSSAPPPTPRLCYGACSAPRPR